jgi:hypothetical protein
MPEEVGLKPRGHQLRHMSQRVCSVGVMVSGDSDRFCRTPNRDDQVCWSDATYVPLSLEPIHGDEYGDYPQRLGVMARRDHEAAVVYLH